MDAFTIILLTGVASLATAGWLFPLKLQYAAVSAAFRLWSFSLLCQAAGWFLISLRWSVPIEYSGIPGSALILIAPVIQLRAFGMVSAVKYRFEYTYALLALTLIAQFVFGYLAPHGPARGISASLLGIIVAAQAIYLILKGRIGNRSRLLSIIVFWYAMVIFSLTMRVLVLAQKTAQHDFDVLGGSESLQIGLVVIFLSAFLPTLGFVNFCAEESDGRSLEAQRQVEGLTSELISRYETIDTLLAGISGFAYRCRNDADWTMTFMSSGVERITGYPAADFIESSRRTFGSILHNEDVDRVWASCRESISSQKPCSNEYRIITFSGEIIWVWDQAKGVYNKAGDLIHIEGLITDITEKKAIETWREFVGRRTEENLKLLDFALDSSVDAVWDFDLKTRDASFSRNWQEMLGFERGELVNNLAAWEARVHPDDLQKANALFAEYANGRETAYDCMQRVMSKTGEYVWIKDRGVIVERDEDGIPVRFVGTLKNIDAEVRHAESGRQEAALLEALFENAPVGISLVGRDGNLIRVNRRIQEIYGVANQADMVSKIGNRKYFLADAARVVEITSPKTLQVEKLEDTVTETFGFADQSGTPLKWVKVTAHYVPEIDRIVRISTDITELKQSEMREATVSQVMTAIAMGYDLHHVLELLCRRIEAELPGVMASVLLVDSGGKHLTIGAAPNLPDFYNEAIEGIEIGPAVGSCGTAAYTGRRTIVDNIPTDPRWKNFRALAEEANLRACWSDPIVRHDGVVLGTFALYQSETGGPDEVALRTIEAAVRLGLIAIERTSDQKALQKSEFMFRTLFEQLPIGISLQTYEREIIDINKVAESYLGLTRDDLRAGKLAGVQYFNAQEEAITFAEHPVMRALNGNCNLYEQTLGFNKGNDRRWVEMNIALMPELRILAVLTKDITDARRQQAELQLSEEKFRQVFELMPIGMALIGKDRTMINHNAALEKISGMTDTDLMAGEAARRTYWTMDGQQIAENDLPVVRALKSGELIQGEIFGMKRGEEVRWVTATVQPIKELGMFLGTLVDITDISVAQKELAELNAQLEERVLFRTQELTDLNRELEAFSYSLSHDIKAPLTRAEGWLNILFESLKGKLDSATDVQFARVRNELHEMNAINQAMLALSRVSGTRLQIAKINLSQVAAEVLNESMANIVKPDAKAHITPGLVVYADAALIRVLLTNLFENSLKFSRDDVAIELMVDSTKVHHQTVYVVRDNGVGFDMQYADKIFAPFQRLHSAAEFKGTGIGLSIVQRIVHRHGGKIWIKSRPEEGTSVFFTLPEREADAAGSPENAII